ncbi:MAG TPA: CHAT domain-containing protein, partial [Candidatus Kapabacteria bacterium]|nr:CHAT domain-containing protein [Candidatus Kapabacteria bacterium]
MSAIIYYVTVDKTGKENICQVTWANKENIIHSFEQSTSGIAPEEMEWMWKDRRNQLKTGEKLFHFLDGHDHHLQQALKEAINHSENLQIHLTTCRETANWPFEILAQKGSFLLPKHVHLVRLIPVQESIKELPPQSRHLKLLFMACSPLDVQTELDFEQEEDGIFKAAEKLAVDMDIEDTGSLAGLREKLEQQTYDIVHLSGYAGIDKKGQPFFIMESETGYREEIPAAKLWHEGLKANPPRMLFLSGSSTGDAPGEIENVFARILVEKYHIPAVLGWGRWISDSEANKAAEIIYKDLTRGKSLLDAIQRARYELYNFSKAIKPSWPQL